MKLFLFFLLTLPVVFAQTESGIGNFHQVDREGQVFRGREPKKAVGELKDLGVTDVIIFKNDVRGEVAREKEDLKGLGIRHHHIPFLWKDLPSLPEACRQTVKALRIMKRVKRAGGKVFFHCTAGEDRTGLLAGIYRMLTDGLSKTSAFETEMCRHGYSDANPGKPAFVVSSIEKGLTPLFLEMARLVETGRLRQNTLEYAACDGIELVSTDLQCN